MTLEILTDILRDSAFFIRGHGADTASTYVFVKIEGIKTESGNRMRNRMKEKDAGKSLLANLIVSRV